MEMRASSEVGFSALCRHSFVRMSDKVRHLGCSLKTPPLGPSAPLRKGFFFFMAQPPLLFRGCCKTLKGRGRNHKKHKKHKNSCAFLCILCFLWFLPRFSFGFCNTLGTGGVDAPLIKCCEATADGADGVVRFAESFREHS